MSITKVVTITPKYSLNEAREDFARAMGLKRRTLTGSGDTGDTSSPNDTADVDDLVSRAAARNRGVQYKDGHSIDTHAIYTMAEDMLKSKLVGIDFKLIYKLAESEVDQLTDPKNIYDVEITGVPDPKTCGYRIHDQKEIIQDGGVKRIDLATGANIVRDDILKIIINSPAYQTATGGSKYIRIIK